MQWLYTRLTGVHSNLLLVTYYYRSIHQKGDKAQELCKVVQEMKDYRWGLGYETSDYRVRVHRGPRTQFPHDDIKE